MRLYVAHKVALWCVLLPALASCAAHRSAGPQAPPAMPARTPGYAAQRRFDTYFAEALRQRGRGNFDAERELLGRALAVNPDAPEALYEAAMLELSLESFADTTHRARGEAMLHRAVALAPGNLHYKEALAMQKARTGDYAAAIRLYKEMVAKEPGTEYLTTLAALQEEAADFAGAIETIGRLEELEGKNERYSLEKFRLYTQLSDNEHAYAAIEDLCAEYPADLRYRVLMADLYQQNGYNEMALAIYRDVLDKEPDNAYGQISLLAYYKQTGADSLYRAMVEEVVLNPQATQEARTEAMRGYMTDNLQTGADSTAVLRLFRKALAMPQENRTLAELCVYYMMLRQMPDHDVAPVLETLLGTEPDYDPARMSLLNIALRQGNTRRAAELCHEGTLYSPGEVTYYYYEAAALSRDGLDRQAIERLKAGQEHIGQETPPELASDYEALLGDLLHGSGDVAAAFEAYARALEYKSDNVLCLNNYAYFLALQGERLEDAEAMSRRAVEAEPDNAIYLDTYAWIMHTGGHAEQARDCIDRAVAAAEESSTYASIFDHAGDIYNRCGERTQAVRFWTKALALYDEPAARAAVKNKMKRRISAKPVRRRRP